MAIPDFQEMMRPALEVVSENESCSIGELREALKSILSITPEELQELIPGGRQKLFDNRVTWATVHLVNAGLLKRPKSRFFVITDEGRDFLKKHKGPIQTNDLKKIPHYRKTWAEFRSKKPDRPEKVAVKKGRVKKGLTPEEIIGEAYIELRDSLVTELLEYIIKSPPAFFEQLVIDLLVAMGYGGSFQDAATTLGSAADGGIDGVIKQDILGLDNIFVQAKRWKDKVVGRPDIQAFVGSLEGKYANKGVFITTSRFTDEAEKYAKTIAKRVVLIDGVTLCQHMIDFKIGVRVARSYDLPAIDLDYFESEQ